jgi:hypothetical protein
MREMLRLRLEGMRRLGLPKARELTEAVVLSLAFDFHADDAFIEADQWFGVGVNQGGRTLWVACDDPADGLLYLWLCLVEASPDRVTRSNGTEADVLAAENETNVLIEHFAIVEEIGDAHRRTAAPSEEERRSHWCTVCEENLKPRTEAHAAIDRAWGTEALEPAVDAAFDERLGPDVAVEGKRKVR